MFFGFGSGWANALGSCGGHCTQDILQCDSGGDHSLGCNEGQKDLFVGGQARLDVELPNRDLSAKYNFNGNSPLLGGGETGKVYMVTNHKGESCAIKHVSKSSSMLARLSFSEEEQKRLRYVELLKQEIRITQMFDHPNIVKLVESFEDCANLYMVIELCTGGGVKDFFMNQPAREADAACVMEHLLGALSYVHDKEICHRDIKPDNMLLQNKEPLSRNTVKLIDFGCACPCRATQNLYERVGTPFFMSPEVIELHYGLAADVWSCGVVMFNILSDRLPFVGQTTTETFEIVKRGNFSFNADAWRSVSEDAKDLIRGLMTFDPKERLTAQSAGLHSWVRKNASWSGSIFRR